ncbi:hypothetical protein HJG60_008756 [Phyllostomus discolor]|uniref:Uncharacterized protein n=1 Tax=Phyllostomus discolor TaxID=89673 RepID=A0A833YWC6_9CHIR|nr:hypothetical protein HJG60_008756 [Phyllostomus discolor]
MTHGRKRKVTSFSSTTSSWPLCLALTWRTRGEGVGAGSRRQSRAPVRTGAAGPLGTLLSPSLLLAPPDPSHFGGEVHTAAVFFSLTTIYVPDNSTHRRANVPPIALTEQLDGQPLTPLSRLHRPCSKVRFLVCACWS